MIYELLQQVTQVHFLSQPVCFLGFANFPDLDSFQATLQIHSTK